MLDLFAEDTESAPDQQGHLRAAVGEQTVQRPHKRVIREGSGKHALPRLPGWIAPARPRQAADHTRTIVEQNVRSNPQPPRLERSEMRFLGETIQCRSNFCIRQFDVSAA